MLANVKRSRKPTTTSPGESAPPQVPTHLILTFLSAIMGRNGNKMDFELAETAISRSQDKVFSEMGSLGHSGTRYKVNITEIKTQAPPNIPWWAYAPPESPLHGLAKYQPQEIRFCKTSRFGPYNVLCARFLAHVILPKTAVDHRKQIKTCSLF